MKFFLRNPEYPYMLGLAPNVSLVIRYVLIRTEHLLFSLLVMWTVCALHFSVSNPQRTVLGIRTWKQHSLFRLRLSQTSIILVLYTMGKCNYSGKKEKKKASSATEDIQTAQKSDFLLIFIVAAAFWIQCPSENFPWEINVFPILAPLFRRTS